MKLWVLVLLVLASASGFAQNPAPAKPQQNAFMSWVHDAWKTVQDQGRPAAARIVKQWPQRFRAVKQTVADLTKTVHDRIAAMDLEQKRQVALELWRVRKSLDLMTLLEPDVLHSLTGLDTTGLASLEKQVGSLSAVVQGQIHR